MIAQILRHLQEQKIGPIVIMLLLNLARVRRLKKNESIIKQSSMPINQCTGSH